MMRAVIDGTSVVNIIEAEEDFELPGFTLVPYAPPGYIGGEYVDGEFSAPPPPPPAIITDRVSSRQFKLQLDAMDLLDTVEAWVDSQPRAVRLSYDNSGYFVRSEPMMQTGFAALGFAEQQVDDFFAAAALL